MRGRKKQKNKLVQSEENIVQAEDKMVQAEDKIVQAEDKIVQAEDKIVQAEDKIVQSEDDIVQAEELAKNTILLLDDVAKKALCREDNNVRKAIEVADELSKDVTDEFVAIMEAKLAGMNKDKDSEERGENSDDGDDDEGREENSDDGDDDEGREEDDDEGDDDEGGEDEKESKVEAEEAEEEIFCEDCSGHFEDMSKCGGYLGCLEKRGESKMIERILSNQHSVVTEVPNSNKKLVEYVKENLPKYLYLLSPAKKENEEEINAQKIASKENEEEVSTEAVIGDDESCGSEGKAELSAKEQIRQNSLKRNEEKELESFREEESYKGREDLRERLRELLEDDDFIDEVVIKSAKVKSKIIEGYLRAIEGRKSVPIINGRLGKTVLQPPPRPKTLEEAKKLVDFLLNKD